MATDLEPLLERVHREIRQLLSPESGQPEDFYGSMQYALGWADEQLRPSERYPGGKLIRPRLCLLSCLAAGGEGERAVPAAASLELLHNFTLVHDDIQDRSPRRHHRPSVWTLIGVPLGINTGDGLFIASHLALGRLRHFGMKPEVVARALEQFDRAALQVCEGQHMDISFEAREPVSTGEYLAMIRRKTAVLMGLSCYLGALSAGAEEEQAACYREFGESLGTAYQVRDDLASVWGEEASTGKRAMEDIYSRKQAYPAVRAFEVATGEDLERLRTIYRQPELTEADAIWVRDLMGSLGLWDEGREKVRECVSASLTALEAAGASGEAAGDLRALSEGLVA